MAKDFFKKGPHAAKNKVNVVDAEVVSGADERKTVILDEQLEGLEFDDKVWLYWKRNKVSIIASVVLAFAIVIGVQGYKYLKFKAEQEMVSAFENASTVDEKAKFAEEYKGDVLAGVALLESADTFYKEGKYEDAQKLYSQSKDDLKNNVLFERALVGEAMSAYSMDASKGIELLKTAYDSSKSLYKAQAGYLYGVALVAQNKTDEAKKILAEVSVNFPQSPFAQFAKDVLDSM